MSRGKRALHTLDDDIADHIERQTQENIERGMTPEEARRQAHLTFGNVACVRADTRAVWIGRRLEELRQDVGYACRTLRRNGAATLVGILVMALAIGATTAVFSVVHAVLLSPLPYANSERIVALTYLSTGGDAAGDRSRQVSVPDFVDWQEQNSSFDAMAYYTSDRTPVTADQATDYAMVATVTDDFFRIFSASPLIGRLFTREEAREGGAGAVIVSDGFARQQFGDPGQAIGRTLRLFNRSVPIVGVMPPTFDYPLETDAWFTAVDRRSQFHRRGNNVRAIGRLHAGISLQRAQGELTVISERLEAQYPDTNKNIRVVVTPLQWDMVGDVSPTLYLLLAAVTFVLLIACATMATLLLARATSRAPEMALRAALGAGRARIVRQLLVEASVQAIAATAIGVTLTIWGTRALVVLSPPDVPRIDTVAINGNVLLFTAVLSAIAGILFGLPPALRVSRRDLNTPLRQGSGRLTGGDSSRAREVLVVAEIALSVTLVATAAVLVKHLIALQHAPLGFDPANVVVMETTARPTQADWGDSRALFQGFIADIEQLPGVVAAGAMMGPPGQVGADGGYWVDRMPKDSPLRSARPAAMNVVAPRTFDVLAMPIEEGRDFTDGDTPDSPPVVIVNRALVRAAFGNREALGRALVAGYDSLEPMTIVGVVGDVRQYGPAREPQPEIYMPYQQHRYNGATLQILAKSRTDPVAVAAFMQRKARERSPEVSVRVSTMDALLASRVATPRFRAWLLSLFAVLALCLAMAGIYGVMAYVAAQRSKEIGLRMALGATTGSVLWLVLGRGLRLTAIGLTMGTAGALVSARAMSATLFGAGPGDALMYAGVIAGLGLLSLLATYVPARRATRIDPLLVLRQD
jgi:putative ABC transport system permease protein